MKTTTASLLAAATLLAAGFTATAAPLPIDQAASLAQGHLRERGLDGRVQIVSLAVEGSALGGSNVERYWYARFSESLAIEEGKRELGLRINFDGSLVKVVETREQKQARADHRTRRRAAPSILDLKH